MYLEFGFCVIKKYIIKNTCQALAKLLMTINLLYTCVVKHILIPSTPKNWKVAELKSFYLWHWTFKDLIILDIETESTL